MLSLAVLTGLAFSAAAQNSPVKFGLKAGVSFANMTASSQNISVSGSNHTSFYVGGTVDIPVEGVFSIQPGLTFIGKGYKYSGSGAVVGVAGNVEEKVSPFYLEIPVNILANFQAGDGKFFVGAGPYYAFGITGKHTLTQTISSAPTSFNENIKFGNDANSDLKRGDFGLNFLAGYQLKNGLSFNASYGLGLSNILPDNTMSVKQKNRVFTVGLGFAF